MAENTRLGGIKQEFQEFKNSFQVMINDLRLEMERKFENTNKRLEELNDHLKTNIVDQMNQRKSSLKLKFLAINLSSTQGEIILKFRVSLHESLMKN